MFWVPLMEQHHLGAQETCLSVVAPVLYNNLPRDLNGLLKAHEDIVFPPLSIKAWMLEEAKCVFLCVGYCYCDYTVP